MQLEHEFTVPAGVDDAWQVLLDIARIAPCLPGATLTSVDGDEFTGNVKVKVGPITVAYGGSGRFVAKDDEKHVAVIEASGKETRGAGTARATVTATLYDDPPDTRVVAVTDLAITGRPAQFGRSVLADVGAKLVGQFADCLAVELAASPPSEASDATAGAARTVSTPPAVTTRGAEPIDLIGAAGVPMLKRLAPIAAAAIVLLIVWRRRRNS